MFPPTVDELATDCRVHRPAAASSGVAWLMDTAARAAEIQQQLAEGHRRDRLLTLHAHYAIEDPRYDPTEVAADLELALCHGARDNGGAFAAEVALFRVARSLLDTLTRPVCESTR